MPEPNEPTTPDPKIAELEAQNATLAATLTATRTRVEAADSYAKAAGSEWDDEKGSYVGGLNFKAAREALSKVDEFSKFDPEKEADKLAAERVKLHESKFAETLADQKRVSDERIGELSKRLGKSNCDDRISEALLAEGAIPEKMPLLKAFADTRIKPHPETLDPVVRNAAGQLDEFVNTETGKLEMRSIREVAVEFKKTYPELFLGTNASGGGAEGGDASGSSSPLSNKKISEMTTSEKVALLAKPGGPEEFERRLSA